MTMPSSPTETPMFPPAPSSMYTDPATLVALIWTLLKSCCCAAATPASRIRHHRSFRMYAPRLGNAEHCTRSRTDVNTALALPFCAVEERREGVGSGAIEGKPLAVIGDFAEQQLASAIAIG